MMCALFDTETLMKVHDNNLYKEALEEGIEKGMAQGMVQGMAQGMERGIDDVLAALRKMGIDETTLQKAAESVKID